MRLALPRISTLALVVALHLHVHLHVHRAGVDYVGVFLAAVASWVALPGPGEAALIAAGISAAHRHLELGWLLAAAWAGASLGGTAGWLVGLKGGRGLLTAPGPLRPVRLALIARGDRFYERYGTLAVFITPSWMAGIHDMRGSRFLPVNAISAALWALSVGLGAYLLGPSITDVIADAGVAGVLVLGALLALAAVLALWRRVRRSR